MRRIIVSLFLTLFSGVFAPGIASELFFSVSKSAARFGETVTLTATVPAVGGTVTFYDGETILGTAPVNSPVVNFETRHLPPGRHTLRAALSSNADAAPASAPPVNLTVSSLPANAFAQSTLSLGAGWMALADFNRDGKSDIATLNAGKVNVLLGNGDGSFQAPIVFGSVNGPNGITAGDFNRDNIPDLAVTSLYDNNVSIFLGNGDGTFRTAVTYPATVSPAILINADLNGDGFLDLIISGQYYGESGSLSVLLGNGDGTFRPAINTNAGNWPTGIAVADFNGDHKLDVVVSNQWDLTTSVLLGNGDGTFQRPLNFSGDYRPNAVVTGDFNNDGKPDFAWLDWSKVTVALGNGDGTFRPLVSYPMPGYRNYSLTAADVNGDGVMDLISGEAGSYPDDPSVSGVAILPGNADGTFQPARKFLAGVYSLDVRAVDLNNDGRMDLIVSGTNINVLLGALATKLRFNPQPANITVQVPTSVTVQATDDNGTPLDIAGPVQISSNPASVLSAGNVVNNAARIGFVFFETGTFTLTASAAGLPSVTSTPFQIQNLKLAFSSQPVNGVAGIPLAPFSVSIRDASGGFTPSTYPVTIASTPAGINATVNATNGTATFSGIVPSAPGTYTLTATSPQADSVVSTSFRVLAAMPATKVGVVRSGVFKVDSNGNGVGPAPTDPADQDIPFTPPGGVLPGDVPVVGDWSGGGRAKAGWFRPTGGQWWLDLNNDGVYTAGVDLNYKGFGGPGDTPVVGDWAGLGKSAIGFVTSGYLWVLDLNADGVFQQPVCAPATPPAQTPEYPNCGNLAILGDAVFAFGSPGDVPVVGNWSVKSSVAGYPISQAGMVRAYKQGNVTVGGPFLWLLDSATAGTSTNVSPQSAHGFINGGIAFGGASDDVPVTGDWYGTGVVQFGMFRGGYYWVLDAAAPSVSQDGHGVGIAFPYGGAPGDRPIVGKW